MCLGFRAERRERCHAARLVAQNLVAVAGGANLTQFSNAVAVVVDADVVFNVQHLAHRLVLSGVHLVGQGAVARVALDVCVHVFVGGGHLLDFILVVSHRHQLGHRDDPPVRDV